MTNENAPLEHRKPSCLSDLALDRFRLGDMEEALESVPASVHLRGCAKCKARLAELDAVKPPPLDMEGLMAMAAPGITGPPRRWHRRALWLAPLGAAAVIALLVPWRAPAERNKGGGWQLGLIVQYPNGRVSRISPGETLAPGDRLRFEVTAPTDAFVSVISLDGAGAVTPFFPVSGGAAAVRAGKQRLLDGAVRLDGALGPERIMLLACPHPVDVTEVVSVGRAALDRAQGHPDVVAALDLPCTQRSFWIRKEVRR